MGRTSTCPVRRFTEFRVDYIASKLGPQRVTLSVMLHHLWNLLSRAFALAVNHMGTSLLAIMAGIILPAILEGIRWNQEGWDAVGKKWRGSAFYGILLTLTWWGFLLLWCTTQTVYEDHQNLVKANGSTIAEIGKLKSELKARGTTVDALQAKIRELEQRRTIRRPELRQRLAKLIAEGTSIRNLAILDQLHPATVSDWRKWRTKVELFLGSELAAADLETFKSFDIDGLPLPQKIMSEIGFLEDVVKQIGH